MVRRLENPMAPPGYKCEMPDLRLYVPLDPWMKEFVKDENPISLLSVLDPTFLITPPDSEEETLKSSELVESLKLFDLIGDFKNNKKIDSEEVVAKEVASGKVVPGKEKKDKRLRKKRSKHNKRSEKSSRSRSPNFRLSSPEQSTSLSKPSLSKRSTSQRHKLPSRQEYSSSRRLSIRTPSRSPPTRSPSPQRRRRSSRSKHYSSSRRSSVRTPSRSPSSSRSFSPSQRSYNSRSYRYSSHRASHTRTPSRSPSLDRLPTRYKHSSYGRSSRHHSSRSNKSPSYQSSPSPCGSRGHSPDRSSRRYLSRISPSRRSPPHQQSSSPRRSPIHHGSLILSGQSSKHSKSTSDEKSKHCKSPRNKSPVRQKKFPIEDDYSLLLAKEMQKRQLWDGSDLEEGEVSEGKAVADTAKSTPEEAVSVDPTKNLSQSESKLEKDELEIVNDYDSQSKPKSKFIKQETDSELLDQKLCMLNSYYCKYCQLSLNSEVTWQSHLNGRKHAKVLKKETVHEVARGSIAVPSISEFVSEDTPRFGKPAAGKRRRRIQETPRIQPAIDETRDKPILGLQSVLEIQSDKEINYYCELCDAPCSAHSILPHLIGYKHQLRFLREIDPDCYERNKLRAKKDFEFRLRDILFKHERKFGRGQMQVFYEWDDLEAKPKLEAYPGPSWRNNPSIKEEGNADDISETPPNDAFLDTSKSDFYCKLCDAHMNNMNMWESHVIGKRHLRNANKIPGENISKVRSVKAPPHVTSKLVKLLREKANDEIIVGLDSIRETQGPNGENYTCFPCGSNCTNYDIIDHLRLTKHKIRYLEKLVADGIPNGITEISQIEIHEESFRQGLIEDECRMMWEKYGSGTVEVYVTKK